MSIPGTAVQRPVTTWMFTLGLVIMGVIALSDLTIDFLPAIDVPSLTVQTVVSGCSPEDVQNTVTEPIESVLGTIPGVKGIRSVTREQMSTIAVAFDWGTDMDFAALSAREKLDQVRSLLPRETGRPTILRMDPSTQPVMTIAVTSAGNIRKPGREKMLELMETVRALIKRRIEQVNGVAQAEVVGGVDREIHVDVHMAMIRALDIDLEQIGEALAASNVDIPSGTVREGLFRHSLRTVDELTALDEIRDLVIRQRASHRPIRVSDCAKVKDTCAERLGLTRFNGDEVIVVQVRKEAGGNTVAVSHGVRSVLDQLRVDHPDLRLEVIADDATFIEESIADVEQAIAIGSVLAFFVLFIFLRKPRYPIIIGLAMPVSVLATFAAMELLQITVNVISLTGLALGIGMLGDNAIVLMENVTRLREEGKSFREATIAGTHDILTAVIASTLTNVAVFLPIVFVDGIAARLFVDMGVTMTIALMASLIIAVTLVPMLLSRDVYRGRQEPNPSSYGLLRLLLERYLRWALDRPVTVLMTTVTFVGITGLLILFMRAESTPDVDRCRFVVQVRMPHGTSLAGLSDLSRIVEGRLQTLPGVRGVLARIGVSGNDGVWGTPIASGETADVDVLVQRSGFTGQLIDSARALCSSIVASTVGVEFSVKPRGTAFEHILRPEENDVRCVVSGRDPATAMHIAEAYGRAIQRVSGLVDIRTSLQEGDHEYVLSVNRDAVSLHGLTGRAVALRLAHLVRGRNATALRDFGREIPIRVQPYGRDRSTLASFLSTSLPSSGGWVPMRALVTVSQTRGVAEIWRENQQRVHLLVANVTGRAVADVVGELEEIAAGFRLPPGYEIRIGGENDEIRESFNDLLLVICLSVALVYMILAAEYESVLYPLVILLTSPLAATGAILAMVLTGQHFNVLSLVGLVIMIGAVDNDAVIAVDMITELRRQGMGAREAILRGMQNRLRPILMTTSTTMLGIVPLVLEFGTGSELVRALTIPLAGGLVTSTVFTVATIPVVYLLIDRWTGGRK